MSYEKLVHELVALDERESKKRGYNPFALPQYLQAAVGVTNAKSFSEHFNPTRGMHRVAKNMGYDLDVERGNWIIKS